MTCSLFNKYFQDRLKEILSHTCPLEKKKHKKNYQNQLDMERTSEWSDQELKLSIMQRIKMGKIKAHNGWLMYAEKGNVLKNVLRNVQKMG